MANWVTDFLAAHSGVQIVRRDRHALHVAGSDGDLIAHITGAPMHYPVANEWRPFDTTLQPLTGNYWGAPGCPARFNVADRTVEIVGSSYAQRTTRVGIFDAANLSIRGTIAIPIGSRVDDSLIADGTIGGAGWQHVMCLTETGVRETLTLAAIPAGLPANVDDWLVLDTIVVGVTFPDGWLEDFGQAGMRFHLPRAHEASNRVLRCRRYARRVGGVQHLYTGIPVSALTKAAYPVVIDPDFSSQLVDGEIYGSNATFATARATSSGVWTIGGASITVGMNYDTSEGPMYSVSRVFLKFNTMTLGSTAVVTRVNLILLCYYDYSVSDFDVQIVKYNWASQDPLTDGNREAAYDGCLAATLDDAIWRNTSSLVTNVQYVSNDLNVAWVNKTAATYYGLMSSEDRNNSTPTGSEQIVVGLAEDKPPSRRPVLVVAYRGQPRLRRPWRR